MTLPLVHGTAPSLLLVCPYPVACTADTVDGNCGWHQPLCPWGSSSPTKQDENLLDGSGLCPLELFNICFVSRRNEN